MPIQGLRRCACCKQEKPLDTFDRYGKDKNRVHSYCHECKLEKTRVWQKANRERCNDNAKRRYKEKREKIDVKSIVAKKLNGSKDWAKRNNHLPCNASVSDLIKEFTTICEICGKDAGLAINMDHCHVSGKFRGFICGRCNVALGMLGDSKETIHRLLKYIQRNGGS